MRLPLSTPRTSFTFLGLCLCLGLGAQEPQKPQEPQPPQQPQQPRPPRQQPPELAQYAAALRIKDAPAKIKELKRIKAEYPDSGLGYNLDYNLLTASSRSARSFGDMLAAQREVIDSSELAGRFLILVNAADMVIHHREAANNKEGVLKTVRAYREEAKALLDAPETFARYEGGTRISAQNSFRTMFEVPLAQALLMNGKGQEALEALEGYKKSSQPNASYYTALGDTYKSLGRDKEALDAYLEATISSPGAATANERNARTLYAKIHGSPSGFDRELDLRKAQRPFQPPPFRVPENWKGKTVLAEVFTGSECGPCVAATFAFDALEKSYPPQYLAVLKYHLPIPAYDPMMNPASKSRQEFYRGKISGTPTAIIEGVSSPRVGGDRLGAAVSFGIAKKEIDAALEAAAGVTVVASAALKGDVVTVDCQFSEVIEGAEYNVALVQAEEEFKGGNGVIHHNMVVRDFKSAAPSSTATFTFNIAESEKAAGAFIAEYAKTASERNRQMADKARLNKIDRSKLKAVVFVQDKDTKRVYNAFVADVAKS